jgi:YD repeat-containing protein
MDIGTTPFVEYAYSSPSNGSRIASMVYPNGRLRQGWRNPRCWGTSVSGTIDYPDRSGFRGLEEAAQHACRIAAPLNSGSNLNAALDNAIGRLDSISDGANSGDAGTVLEQYSYLGLSTIVARNHPQTGINLTYIGPSGGIGPGGDQYVGLDQFGRVVDQNWVDTSTGQSTDNFTYSYDANSNVAAENNLLNTAYSQTFTYDPFNRLASNTLGGLANQSWTLDSQGNWSSFTSNGTTQTETTNTQNQITSISGSVTPTYDANGNAVSIGLTGQPAGSADTLVYDAWNRLVSVTNSSGTVIAQYTYNAMGYRITESYPQGGTGIPAGTVKYLYYSTQEQVIEERWNGTANSNTQYQYVWSASYVNAMILRDSYSAGTIQSNSRIYTTYDANYDVTSLIGYNSSTQTWGVVERFAYSPYGTVTVLSGNWTSATDAYSWQYMYQGGRQDPITQLYAVARLIVGALILIIRDVRMIGKRMDDMELWP